jgi:nitrite reductase (NADH) small subunit
MEDNWIKVGKVEDFPENGGACVLHEEEQIAVYNFTMRNEWFATQNSCPHREEMVLSRGMLGDVNAEPKVACPLHKRSFSLKTGECLSGDDYKLKTYPVKVEGADVLLNVGS